MEVTFEEHFKQPHLADAEIVIIYRTEAGGGTSGAVRDEARQADQQQKQKQQQQQQQQQQCKELARFPVHQLFLLKSDFFKAQVQRWLSNNGSDATCAAPAAAAAAAGIHSPHRPTLELTVDSAEHLPAAEAVIAAMYGMAAPIQLLSQVQLLAAALIADRIHVTAAVKLAVAALEAAAGADAGLSGAALAALASLPAWPACLLPLLAPAVAGARCCNGNSSGLASIQAADTGGCVRRMLLAALGDLEAVWADEQLKQILLALPLPAVQLLLSSDELHVANEDTVLYIATQYMMQKLEWELRAAVQAALAPSIRCPHLSRFALMWTTLAGDTSQLLLAEYAPQLRQLLSLRCVADACTSSNGSSNSTTGTDCMLCSSGDGSSMMEVSSTAAVAAAAAEIEDAPDSWRLRQRRIRPRESAARVCWRLPVQKLTEACRESVVQQQGVTLEGPDSPPVGGVAWRMRIVCDPKGSDRSVIGGYADIVAPDDSIFYAVHVTLNCKQGVSGGTTGGGVQHELRTPLLRSVIGYGDDDYFGIGPMGCGGWDEARWAAKGLPTDGELELEMVVHSVC